MGDIGRPIKHIEYEPLDIPGQEPIHEPAAPEREPVFVPAPDREEEEVPA